MASLTWHGHSTFSIVTAAGIKIVIDPFFDDNPRSDLKAAQVEADFIVVSHGHADHFADCIPIARRTGATVISTFEIASFCAAKGVEHTHGMNIGGGWQLDFGRLQLTAAIHSGTVAGDDTGTHTTICSGLLFDIDGTQVYHAGDTALTMDMQLLKGHVDVALLPIGDNFTMGPRDAARAVEFIEPDVVVPMHYGTWPIIEQDPQEFVKMVGDRARVVVLEPGGQLEL